MDAIDKLYQEWAWRSKTGVPSMEDLDDIAILNELYEKWGILSEEDDDLETPEDDEGFLDDDEILKEDNGDMVIGTDTYNPAKKTRKPREKKEKIETVKNPDYVLGVLERAEATPREIEDAKNSGFYRNQTLQDFVENPKLYCNHKMLKELYKRKVKRGGYGELIPFVVIGDAKLGESSGKDIYAGGKILEVKELKNNMEFSAAGQGTIVGSAFLKHLEMLIKYLNPIKNRRDAYTKLLDYYEKSKGYSFSQKAIDDVEKVIKLVREDVVYVKDEKYVKIDGKLYVAAPGVSYAIKYDLDKGDFLADLELADDVKYSMSKLKKHPWIASKSSHPATDDLNKIKDDFTKGIDYFLFYVGPSHEAHVVASKDYSEKIKPGRIALGGLNLIYVP